MGESWRLPAPGIREAFTSSHREGVLLATIPVPEAPANVEFGGGDRRTLYIMAGKSLYRIRTNLTGFLLWPPRPG
jgi:sugar lactone lactonase YvrE